MSTILRSSLLGFLAVSFMACGGSSTPPTPPGISGSVALDRIVGGAAFAGLPAVGSITVNGQNYCTGTLISSRRVVTAAHCLGEYSASAYKFAIGPNALAPTKVYNVVGGAQHPSWNEDTLAGDIAYLTLDQDATETPVQVLNNLDSTWLGASLTFVGYGTDDGQRQSGNNVKRSVIMPISEVGATQFAYETAGKNTCNGDSGGPAFFVDQGGNYLLAGTTSYGDPTCTDYGVDTTVAGYTSWLGVSGTAPSATPLTAPTGPTTTYSPTDGDPRPVTDSASGCGNVSFAGECDGNIVTWCEQGQLYEVDCTVRNKSCIYSEYDGYYGCGTATDTTGTPTDPTGTPTDSCHGETYQGRCDGTTLVWCESGNVLTVDCGSNGGCSWDASYGVNDCANTSPTGQGDYSEAGIF